MRKTPNAVKEANRFSGLDIYGGLKKPQRKKLRPALEREVVIAIPSYAFNALNGVREMTKRSKLQMVETFRNEGRTIVESGVPYDVAINMIVSKLMELRKQQG